MINVYWSGTGGGNGKIATLSKTENRELTKLVTSTTSSVTMRLNHRYDDALLFNIELDQYQKIPRTTIVHEALLKCSPIDNDIYNCFIASKSGIGTWKEFQEVEQAIAALCKDQGGRYYKTKSKNSKFAIIFSPYSYTTYEVCNLQQQGYKVTFFDFAVRYFGLENMPDCQRHSRNLELMNEESVWVTTHEYVDYVKVRLET